MAVRSKAVTPVLRRCAALFVGVAALAMPAVARARETYPAALEEALDLGCVPGCYLCHFNSRGGGLLRPFGFAVGFELDNVNDPDSIAPALAELRTANADTDLDTIPDITELEQGTDPSLVGAEFGCPRYGCGASLAKPRAQGEAGLWPALAGLGTALLLWRAARRRARMG